MDRLERELPSSEISAVIQTLFLSRSERDGTGASAAGDQSASRRSDVGPLQESYDFRARLEFRSTLEIDPTVFIVDDDESMRESLAWLIRSVHLEAETYASAIAFLESYDPSRPGCLISDIRMPGLSGLELQERLRLMSAKIPTMMITGYADVGSAVRAMKAGAMDFLEKPVCNQVLLDRIQEAIDRDLSNRADLNEQFKIDQRLSRLTHREREVMALVIEGRSSKQIAAILNVSFKTVEAHRSKVMKKMQAKSIPHLIRMSYSQEQHQ